MADKKQFIIQVQLEDDGTVNLKKLQKALDDVTKSQKAGIKVTQEKTKALKGSEAALLAEIRALKADRAANSNSIAAYQKATVAITKVEDKLRKLTEARNKDVQVNAQFISNQGLASNSIVEFGRLISDAPFGIIGITNNISQLGNQLGTLSRKTGSARASFDILIKQLKSGGALILGFQILISLITLYRDEITEFVKGTNTAAGRLKKLREEIEETNKTFDAEEAKLILLNTVINDNTASRDAQISAANELASILPNLTAKQLLNKESIEETTIAIEDYIEQQKLRSQRDAIIDSNAEVFFKKDKLRRIDLIEDDDIRAKALDDFVKSNRNFFDRLTTGFEDFGQGRSIIAPAVATIGGLYRAIAGESEEKRAELLVDIRENVDTTVAGLLETLTTIQKEINTVASGGKGKTDLDEFTSPFDKLKEEAEILSDVLADVLNFKGSGDLFDIPEVDDFAEAINGVEFRDSATIAFNERAEFLKGFEIRAAEDKITLAKENAVKELDGLYADLDNRIGYEEDLLKITEFYANERIKVGDKEAESRQRTIREVGRAVSNVGKLLQDVAGENKKTAIAGVIIEKAGAIAQIVANTAIANAKAMGVSPLTGGQPFVGINTGSAIVSIGATIAQASKAIEAIRNPEGSSSGGGGAAALPSRQIQPPAFNVVGATQESQLAQTIAGSEEKPIKAFVVASDVTTAQELARTAIISASIG